MILRWSVVLSISLSLFYGTLKCKFAEKRNLKREKVAKRENRDRIFSLSLERERKSYLELLKEFFLDKQEKMDYNRQRLA